MEWRRTRRLRTAHESAAATSSSNAAGKLAPRGSKTATANTETVSDNPVGRQLSGRLAAGRRS